MNEFKKEEFPREELKISSLHLLFSLSHSILVNGWEYEEEAALEEKGLKVLSSVLDAPLKDLWLVASKNSDTLWKGSTHFDLIDHSQRPRILATNQPLKGRFVAFQRRNLAGVDGPGSRYSFKKGKEEDGLL